MSNNLNLDQGDVYMSKFDWVGIYDAVTSYISISIRKRIENYFQHNIHHANGSLIGLPIM
jgi:hypothetical protein